MSDTGATHDFGTRMARRVRSRASSLVIGLDPDPARVLGGAQGAAAFCARVVRAAAPACVAAKIQLATFERFGADGWRAYEETADMAADAGLMVIADAKRGDIGITATAYAEAFLRPPVDALTVNPSLGGDAVAPFVAAAEATGTGIFCLVRTSNPGAADLQDLALAGGGLWHERLAAHVARWGAPSVGEEGLSSVGAVVGATVPERMAALRDLMPEQIFLIPGVGAQGGRPTDLGAAFAGRPERALVSASRSIIYADDPAGAAEELRGELWTVAGGA